MTHRCQSKTLSSPDFESTYTNMASFEACGVLISTGLKLSFGGVLLYGKLRLPFFFFFLF